MNPRHVGRRIANRTCRHSGETRWRVESVYRKRAADANTVGQIHVDAATPGSQSVARGFIKVALRAQTMILGAALATEIKPRPSLRGRGGGPLPSITEQFF